MSKKIVNHLLNYAAKNRADQLVIEGTRDRLSCQYRFKDGSQHSFTLPQKLEKSLLDNLRQILKIAPGELASDRYCRIHNRHYSLAFRLTILPAKNGEKAVISIAGQPELGGEPSLEKIGLAKDDRQTIEKALQLKSGLVIISAPDGQGKNTTLKALLSSLDLSRLNSYYFAQRPEIRIDGLNCLKPTAANWDLVLRQDSDLIVMNDAKDKADFQLAVRAAASGRLVLMTTTAASVWEVLALVLKSEGPLDPKLDSLRLIVNQRLARLKRSPKTKKPRQKTDRHLIGLFEVLLITPEIRRFIKTAADKKLADRFWEKIALLALEQGYRSLKTDWQEKVSAKIIAPL